MGEIGEGGGEGVDLRVEEGEIKEGWEWWEVRGREGLEVGEGG